MPESSDAVRSRPRALSQQKLSSQRSVPVFAQSRRSQLQWPPTLPMHACMHCMYGMQSWLANFVQARLTSETWNCLRLTSCMRRFPSFGSHTPQESDLAEGSSAERPNHDSPAVRPHRRTARHSSYCGEARTSEINLALLQGRSV